MERAIVDTKLRISNSDLLDLVFKDVTNNSDVISTHNLNRALGISLKHNIIRNVSSDFEKVNFLANSATFRFDNLTFAKFGENYYFIALSSARYSLEAPRYSSCIFVYPSKFTSEANEKIISNNNFLVDKIQSVLKKSIDSSHDKVRFCAYLQDFKDSSISIGSEHIGLNLDCSMDMGVDFLSKNLENYLRS